MIQFDNFGKQYDNGLVIALPSLVLDAGVYWLKGENGSGKTTLMRSIAGLQPFDGDIQVDGKSIRRHKTAYKGIVNHAEAEPLYPGFLTGDDLVRFYIDAKKGDVHDVAALSGSLGINSYSSRKMATYSSGMIKKLSLVLAFIGRPKLILLDEPLITLDSTATAQLQMLITEHAGQGISFIISSHQQLILPGIKMHELNLVDKTIKRL